MVARLIQSTSFVLDTSEFICCGLPSDMEFGFEKGIRLLEIMGLGRILSHSKFEI